MFREFFAAPSAGRDRDGACAQRLAAGNIAGRIADDIDLVRGKFPAVLFFSAGAGKFSEFVPIVVIVGESAKFKKMPDAVVTEFELCTAGDVPSEEPKDEMLARFQLFKQFEDPGQ